MRGNPIWVQFLTPLMYDVVVVMHRMPVEPRQPNGEERFTFFNVHPEKLLSPPHGFKKWAPDGVGDQPLKIVDSFGNMEIVRPYEWVSMQDMNGGTGAKYRPNTSK
uniref:Uncharacterized protein n=1 Tax=Chromera velia CCMP2878 TaxID=1169474 RepID=A0A0G4FT77_9ALVE|eukprot:Cvel_18630.t1-p1 / transcript=Cvel_18630.t1 / gene=Cvel_18630 / organism=Chromera_velia_CCMP2878 / gene_product=hypothetical protein / transcript_product=hypothetical protein / location=Cvel_scaffold1556:3855-4169(-) / protein_length=105 / sequence_SO=supercontig / SO=protein_coding / is_pseudo=false